MKTRRSRRCSKLEEECFAPGTAHPRARVQLCTLVCARAAKSVTYARVTSCANGRERGGRRAGGRSSRGNGRGTVAGAEDARGRDGMAQGSRGL